MASTRKTHALRALGLLALSVIGLAGCTTGEATEGRANNAATGDCVSGSLSDGTIKIGAVAPLSGALAGSGAPQLEGYRLAVDKVNAAGGIHGSEVELLARDDVFDAGKSAAATEELISADGVVAVLGTYGSVASLAMSAVAEQFGVPGVYPNMIDPTATQRGFKYMFSTQRNAKALQEPVNGLLTQQVKPKTAALVGIDAPWAEPMFNSATESLEASGIKVVLSERIATAQSNYAGVTSKLAAARPEAVLYLVYPNDFRVLLNEAMQFNVGASFVYANNEAATLPGVRDALGDSLEGVVHTAAFDVSNPSAEIKAVQDAYLKAKGGHDVPTTVLQGYQAAEILLDGIDRACSLDADAIADAIRSTDGFDTVFGPASFEENGQIRIDTQVYQIQGGKSLPVWPRDVATAEVVSFAG